MLSINELRTGTYFVFRGDPYVVIKHGFVKMGRGQGIMRATIRNLKTSQVLEESFKGQEKIEEADIRRSKASYLYQEGNNYNFMDSENYDQFFVTAEQLDDKKQFLIENLVVDVINFNEMPINIELPKKIKLKVKLAPPGVKGDTAQGSATKKVTLENDLTVDVPLFIKQDETIEVNTETGKYVGKA